MFSKPTYGPRAWFVRAMLAAALFVSANALVIGSALGDRRPPSDAPGTDPVSPPTEWDVPVTFESAAWSGVSGLDADVLRHTYALAPREHTAGALHITLRLTNHSASELRNASIVVQAIGRADVLLESARKTVGVTLWPGDSVIVDAAIRVSAPAERAIVRLDRADVVSPRPMSVERPIFVEWTHLRSTEMPVVVTEREASVHPMSGGRHSVRLVMAISNVTARPLKGLKLQSLFISKHKSLLDHAMITASHARTPLLPGERRIVEFTGSLPGPFARYFLVVAGR